MPDSYKEKLIEMKDVKHDDWRETYEQNREHDLMRGMSDIHRAEMMRDALRTVDPDDKKLTKTSMSK